MNSTIATALRILGTLFFVLLFVWGVLPTLTGRFHSGCLALILAGAVGAFSCVCLPLVVKWWSAVWQTVAGKIVLSSFTGIAAALLLLFCAVSCLMVAANCQKPAQDATVVVLGAALRGENPSRLLRERLETAKDYLHQNPTAVCVVSGGQGEDEVCSEALVMKRYLMEHGIAEQRIYMEDNSTSTFENIRFSKELIKQHGLSQNIALVTQEFHQYRASKLARQAGFENIGALPSQTPFYLLGSYWVRDFAGVCHLAVFGW